MMDCKKVEKLLIEYLYQELSPEKTLEVEKHLEVCDACAKTLHNWRGIHRGFQRAGDLPQPAPFLKTRIMAAAKEEIDRKIPLSERFFSWVKPALILPVMIFVMLVLVFFPTRKFEMAKAKVPSQAVTPAPPATSAQRQEPAMAERRLEASKGGSLSDLRAPATEYDAEKRYRDTAPADELKKTKEAPAEFGERNEPRKNEAESVPMEAQEGAEAKPDISQNAPAAPAPAAQQELIQPSAAKIQSKLGNYEEAQNRFRNGDLQGGKDVADDAIRSDKDGSLAAKFHQDGRLYQQQGEPQQAIIQYNLVLNNYPSYPDSPDVLLGLAESYEQIGEYDKAIKAYRQLQRVASMKKVATERMQSLNKKQQVQEQLRSLGYVDKN
jgi:tetratricopeptide (TPR) repeat protein